PLVLERAQRSVQVPDVDPVVTGELGETLEELVAVRRPIGQQYEEGWLAEALDACPHLPLAAVVADAVPGAEASPSVHAGSICNLHMSVTDDLRRSPHLLPYTVRRRHTTLTPTVEPVQPREADA